jgi:2-polyprenyl-3-methyl-5-hydroxy-6-metoxy-1,4-benzoquinol methylase
MTKFKLNNEQEEFWEKNASQWNEVMNAGTFKNRILTNAALLNKIKSCNIKSVLDVGCGEGWLAANLNLPQVSYLGLDGSNSLVKMAQKKHKAQFKKVSYAQILNGDWVPDQLFEDIVFNFSLLEQNTTDLLICLSKFLTPSGFLLIQTLHPCFTLNEYRDGCNKEDFKSSPIEFFGEMPWFGRTLGSWVQVFQSSGLTLKEIDEPLSEKKPVSLIFVLQLSPSPSI